MKKTLLLFFAATSLLLSCTKNTPPIDPPVPDPVDSVVLDNDKIESQYTFSSDQMTTLRIAKGSAPGHFLIYGFVAISNNLRVYVLREIDAEGKQIWMQYTEMVVADIDYYYAPNGRIMGYVLVGTYSEINNVPNSPGIIKTVDAISGDVVSEFKYYDDQSYGLCYWTVIKHPTNTTCGFTTNYYALGSAYRDNTYYPCAHTYNIDEEGKIAEGPGCPAVAEPLYTGIDLLQPNKVYMSALAESGYQIVLLTGEGPLTGKSYLQKTHLQYSFTPDWEITENVFYKPHTLVPEGNGNYYIAGSKNDLSAPNGAGYWQDAVISKFSGNGNVVWSRSPTGEGKTPYDDVLNGLVLIDYKVYGVGKSRFIGTDQQPFGNAMLTSFNTNGDMLSCQTFGNSKYYSGFNSCLYMYQKLFCFGFTQGLSFTKASGWIAEAKL